MRIHSSERRRRGPVVPLCAMASPAPATAAPWALLRWAAVIAAFIALLVGATNAQATLGGEDVTTLDARDPSLVWQPLVRLHKVPPRYDGRGVTVALIDTGVTPGPDLGGRLLLRVDFTPERDGLDRFGHGTHMAGLIAGDGTASGGVWAGAAPGANLISLKVASWNGVTDVTQVIAALHWVVVNADKYNIRIVNLSYGTDAVQPYLVDPLNRAVERAIEAGILVVASSGNSGPAPGTITKPADDPRVLTVGAFDDANTVISTSHSIPSFTSRGPTRDGLAKPDLVAPGVSIVSLRAPGSVADEFRPLARVGTEYFKGSGTSQAAAIVSGIAARVIQASPRLSPDRVKALLVDTANDNLRPLPGAGAGAVNARDAIRSIVENEVPRAAPVPRPSNGLGPIDASRGSARVYADLNRDGLADLVTGEVDVLGVPFTESLVNSPWNATTWAASPWAPIAVETPGSLPTPAGVSNWSGVGPDPQSWAARSWGDAGWDARSWGARSWGTALWN